MPEQSPSIPVGLSLNRIRSNPILASEREFSIGWKLRDKERRQLNKLEQLQNEGVPLHCIPKMYRVDATALKPSSERIGVAGLVVDNRGIGYVTKLIVEPNSTWDISVDLPFPQARIQRLLLRVLSGSGLDESLPELFAYRITDTLAECYEGDSMDIACLLAIFDASVNLENRLLHAAAAVVSPVGDGMLEPSKSISAKLKAFVREFGHGSLLVRHASDEEASGFDEYFDDVWPVKDLSDLAVRLHNAGLTHSLLEKVALKSEHGFAIASQMQRLLSSESTFDEAAHLLARLNRRASDETPLKIRLELSLAQEDLHRHRGNFDAAIAARTQRSQMMLNPFVSCYEREADSDNRHAAALYDAHRFVAAIDCLAPWAEKLRDDPKICLPETRAKLLNTLARCLVAMADPQWEELFNQSLEIQRVSDPGNIPHTESFLTHALLKCNRFEEARQVLKFGGDESNPFRIWLAAECSRQSGDLWDDLICTIATSIPESNHANGFACQAIARQRGRQAESQVRFFENARRSFEHGMESDVTNVKRVLGAYCTIAIAVVEGNSAALSDSIIDFRKQASRDGLREIRKWYENELNRVERDRDWEAIEALFNRVPHL